MPADSQRSPDAQRACSELRTLAVHEGKTIHQFSDRWDTLPRYAIRAADLADKPQSTASARHYRAACREVARSTDERTAIATMLPPGVLCGHTISVERTPMRRPNAAALSLVGRHEQLSVRLAAATEGRSACKPVYPCRNFRYRSWRRTRIVCWRTPACASAATIAASRRSGANSLAMPGGRARRAVAGR